MNRGEVSGCAWAMFRLGIIVWKAKRSPWPAGWYRWSSDSGATMRMDATIEDGPDAEPWFGAIDQGTTSTRFLIFDHAGQVVASAQHPVRLNSPRPGWVEQDPEELIASVERVISDADQLVRERWGVGLARKLRAVGLTNQRETTVAWDAETSQTYGPAIVWMDTRTEEAMQAMGRDEQRARLHRQRTGLPPSPYFSGSKMQWMMKNRPRLMAAAADHGKGVKFGTVDSWILWNLLGGRRGRKSDAIATHVSDVTNACRTALLDLEQLSWSEEMLALYGVARETLPQIKASVAHYGAIQGTAIAGVAITAVLGDQHAALLGHGCVERGQVKGTFGTGCFILGNTGHEIIRAPPEAGLLTTVAFQLGEDQRPHYALEAPISCGGSTLEWLSKQLEILEDPRAIDTLAAGSSEGVILVPSLAGMLAPRWRPGARGALVGLSLHSRREHLLRAALEAIAFANKEAIDLIHEQLPQTEGRRELVVDGGLANSDQLMQILADSLGMPIARPALREATAFGAARAAAMGAGFPDWPRVLSPPRTLFAPHSDLQVPYKRWRRCVDLVSRLDADRDGRRPSMD